MVSLSLRSIQWHLKSLLDSTKYQLLFTTSNIQSFHLHIQFINKIITRPILHGCPTICVSVVYDPVVLASGPARLLYPMDEGSPTYRDQFAIPTFQLLGITHPDFSDDDLSIYFCGNSLGLMPQATPKAIEEELKAWHARAVEAHFNHPNDNHWVDIDLPLLSLTAPLVGAKENEVAVMGSLTANLNALLVSFYKPKGSKTKILFEKHAFPSDYYAFLNLVKIHGYDESHLIQIAPKEGDTYLKTKDIIAAIEQHKDELALVCFPGIQYYTGQWFDIPTITKAGHDAGAVVGWDLAHAVGNVPLELHAWNVDFAVWCNYKYLNLGPGAMAGIFVHENHTKENSAELFPPRLAGWWGNNASDRFKMLEKFDPIQLALSYRQLNPSVLDVVAVKTSYQLVAAAGGVTTLRQKSLALTQHLWDLLVQSPYYNATSTPWFKILTPEDPAERGAQLSVLFGPHSDDPAHDTMEQVFQYLHDHAIICDERRPNVIRLAPTPLYNTFKEVEIVVQRVNEALDAIARKHS